MNKYQLLENQFHQPISILYGDLNNCPLIRNKVNGKLAILKITSYQQFQHEFSILKNLKHQNILKILDYMVDAQSQAYIVLQFAVNGNLHSKIKHGALKKKDIKKIFCGICSAILYIHQKGYIHRNLKPENILLDQNMEPKIMDFGLASKLQPRRTLCGCFYYMAPQLIKGLQYNHKVDVWALGVILYEMIEEKAPFQGNSMAQIFESMHKPILFSKKFSRIEIELIKSMLRVNFSHRSEIKSIFKNKYFESQEQFEIIKGKKQSHLKQQINYNQMNKHELTQQPKTNIIEKTIDWIYEKIRTLNDDIEEQLGQYAFQKDI